MTIHNDLHALAICLYATRESKQDRHSIEGRPPANEINRQAFCSFDLEIDLMTLIYEGLDLKISPYSYPFIQYGLNHYQ